MLCIVTVINCGIKWNVKIIYIVMTLFLSLFSEGVKNAHAKQQSSFAYKRICFTYIGSYQFNYYITSGLHIRQGCSIVLTNIV